MSVEEIAKQVDVLIEEAKLPEAYDLLTKTIGAGQKDPELYWRLALVCRGQALKCSKSDEQNFKRYLQEGLDAAKAGLVLKDDHAKCNCWFGICLNYLSKLEGSNEQIKKSYIMREHWDKALKADPKDPVTLHSLGLWCYNIASLPWIKRKLAETFLTKPPESSYDEALKFLLESEKLSTTKLPSTLLHIAQCYYELKKKNEAKEYCNKVLQCPENDQEAEECAQSARELLKKC